MKIGTEVKGFFDGEWKTLVIFVSMTENFWLRCRPDSNRIKVTGGVVAGVVAVSRYEEVLRAIRHLRNDRRGKSLEVAMRGGVLACAIGEQIQVQFKQGWQTVTYAGVVPGSGNVRFTQPGSSKFRTTHPKFCRTLEAVNS